MLLGVVVAYAGLVGLLMIFETKLIFFPSVHPEGDWALMGQVGAQDVWLTTHDNVKIHAAWLPHPDPTTPTVLFFHGNAGNLAGRLPLMGAVAKLGCSVLIVDYRGYGKSEGSPNEQGVYRDAEAAYAWLTTEKGVDPARLVVWGNSLGGGVATELASRQPAAALILSSTFTSIPDMAGRSFPFIPSALIRTQLNNLSKIAELTLPLLIIHSRNDTMIPFVMAEQLHAAAHANARLLLVSGPDHNDVMYSRRAEIFAEVSQLLAAL